MILSSHNTVGLLVASCFISQIMAQGLLAPPPGKVYLGAWLDTADPEPGKVIGDRPVLFNDRMGFKASGFQYAQNMPIDTFPAPDEQVKATGTDAFILLTVYPMPSPWTIADADIAALAAQCKRLNNDEKRKLLIRFGPEMNGEWMRYGQRPAQFKALWIRVYNAVKANCPSTGMVWAPNFGSGYPYQASTGFSSIANTLDFTQLDTNNDGVINNQDDPYSPYYPGDQYVDWVGMSVYHFGSQSPWLDNVEAAPGKFESILNLNNFYQFYAVGKNKPMQIAEGAAAFHTNTTLGPGVGELAVKRSWWRQWLTNATFIRTFDHIKMFDLFEFRKNEELTNRDFRVTTDKTIRDALLQDFQSVKDLYLYGNVTGEIDKTGTENSIYRNGDAGYKQSNVRKSLVVLGITLSLMNLIFV